MKPIHRGVVGLTEPGAATSAMVALTASQRAVAHYVSSGKIGIGTGRFGIRGTHLEPLADLTCPHILQESLPIFPFEANSLKESCRASFPQVACSACFMHVPLVVAQCLYKCLTGIGVVQDGKLGRHLVGAIVELPLRGDGDEESGRT